MGDGGAAGAGGGWVVMLVEGEESCWEVEPQAAQQVPAAHAMMTAKEPARDGILRVARLRVSECARTVGWRSRVLRCVGPAAFVATPGTGVLDASSPLGASLLTPSSPTASAPRVFAV